MYPFTLQTPQRFLLLCTCFNLEKNTIVLLVLIIQLFKAEHLI